MTLQREPPTYPTAFEPGEGFARALDARDPLREYRDRFHLPQRAGGGPLLYLCSHSLGLQPRSVRPWMEQELRRWADLGVGGHFEGDTPWYTFQDSFRDAASRLVGARPSEVVFMNGLTVNLHLMMETFYRPQPGRFKILIEEPAFPSDLFALKSQVRRHGYDPADALIIVTPRQGEHHLRTETVEQALQLRGSEIALVFLNVVNFLTGQLLDAGTITRAAKRHGCLVGLDLAHAAGNVPLRLHDWGVDFAVWCTYKYLNSGPGAVAGCFVHERHGADPDLSRLAGWWGNDPAKRFRMQLQPEFVPQEGAAGWQVSNPSILALVPVRASLAIFDEVGMASLRARASCLTSYLLYLLDRWQTNRLEVLTPRDPAQRGCQISLRVQERAQELFDGLGRNGVIGDFRQPDVIRVAPVPLYNTFVEVFTFVQILARELGRGVHP